MRRLMPAAVALLVLVVILPAIADKAKTLYEKGQDAEARQNYEAAYNLYKQAYDLRPKDLRYRSGFERMRFKAAATLVITQRGCGTRASCRRLWRNFKKPLSSTRRCSSRSKR